VPDYTKTPHQVYVQAAELIIRTEGHLRLLSSVEGGRFRKTKDLPSWVPDFSTSNYPAPFSRHSTLPFWADRGLGARYAEFPEPGVLEVKGYRLNEVSATAVAKNVEEGGLRPLAEFLANIPNGVMVKKPMNLSAEEQARGLDTTLYAPQSRLEIFWRTLITDEFRGEHLPPHACGLAYKISYRRYLSSLSAHMLDNITSLEDYQTKWDKVLDENDAFESMLLPEEMKSLVSENHWLIVGSLFANRNTQRQQLADKDPSKATFIMLDGGDFGAEIPPEWLNRGDNLPWDNNLEADYMHEKAICQENRVLAIISPGGLALAPESTAIDDEVWIIAGSPIPLMLRPLGQNRYRLIGGTYVHGIMHGEGLEGVDLEKFLIFRI
jgi:hypothetical protein